MKSIMYHYVQKSSGQKYAKYLDYKKFEKQIIYFKKNFKFFNCLNLENFIQKIILIIKFF